MDDPENGNADGVGNAGDNVQLGRDNGIVGDDAVLAEVDELVGGGIAIGKHEIANQIHPSLAQAAEVAEDLPVGLGADGKVGLARGQFLGTHLLEEEPGRAQENQKPVAMPTMTTAARVLLAVESSACRPKAAPMAMIRTMV